MRRPASATVFPTIDGQWVPGPWSDWNATCGPALQTRSVLCVPPVCGGQPCPGSRPDPELDEPELSVPELLLLELPLPLPLPLPALLLKDMWLRVGEGPINGSPCSPMQMVCSAVFSSARVQCRAAHI